MSVRKHINQYHRTKILRLRNDLTALKQRSRAIIKMKLSNSPEQTRKPLSQLLKKVPRAAKITPPSVFHQPIFKSELK